MISGGINEKEKFIEELIFITFTGGNMFNPSPSQCATKSRPTTRSAGGETVSQEKPLSFNIINKKCIAILAGGI
jgi:hypothetical protein